MGNKLKKPSFGSKKKKEPKAKKESNGPFSLRSAFLVTMLLTVFLWWLPIFGQMVAGYVGGRKSGSPAKGLLVTASAVGIFVLAAYTISFFGYSILDAQNYLITNVFASYPAVSEFVTSTFGYMQSFFETFGALTSASVVIFATTAAFGVIGGIVAGQVRLEAEYRAPVARTVNNMTVSAANSGSRSVESYKQGRSMGFGSFDDYLPVHAMQVNSMEGTASAKPLVRKASAREAPEQVREEPVKESPLSSVLQMSDRNAQPREKPAAKDDFEYI